MGYTNRIRGNTVTAAASGLVVQEHKRRTPGKLKLGSSCPSGESSLNGGHPRTPRLAG